MNELRDMPLGTSSAAARAHHERALWHLVSFYGDPMAACDAVIAADPGWGLARTMKAVFILTLTEPNMLAQARQLLVAAEPLMGRVPSDTNARTWLPRRRRLPGAGARPARAGTLCCETSRATC